MVSKTLILIGIVVAIGLSSLRNSSLAKFLIIITGGVRMFDLITTNATYYFLVEKR